MAGERTAAGSLREVSGVCTHPAFQGRGLARRLMRKLVRRQLQRGELPLLHVMGFRNYLETVVRVVSVS